MIDINKKLFQINQKNIIFFDIQTPNPENQPETHKKELNELKEEINPDDLQILQKEIENDKIKDLKDKIEKDNDIKNLLKNIGLKNYISFKNCPWVYLFIKEAFLKLTLIATKLGLKATTATKIACMTKAIPIVKFASIALYGYAGYQIYKIKNLTSKFNTINNSINKRENAEISEVELDEITKSNIFSKLIEEKKINLQTKPNEIISIFQNAIQENILDKIPFVKMKLKHKGIPGHIEYEKGANNKIKKLTIYENNKEYTIDESIFQELEYIGEAIDKIKDAQSEGVFGGDHIKIETSEYIDEILYLKILSSNTFRKYSKEIKDAFSIPPNRQILALITRAQNVRSMEYKKEQGVINLSYIGQVLPSDFDTKTLQNLNAPNLKYFTNDNYNGALSLDKLNLNCRLTFSNGGRETVSQALNKIQNNNPNLDMNIGDWFYVNGTIKHKSHL